MIEEKTAIDLWPYRMEDGSVVLWVRAGDDPGTNYRMSRDQASRLIVQLALAADLVTSQALKAVAQIVEAQ